MIRRAMFFSLLLLFPSLAILSFFLFVPNQTDYESYEKIQEKQKRSLTSNTFPKEEIHQMRDNVQKDLWVMNDNERLHFRIFSDHSDLTLQHKEKEMEIIENLKNIQCWIQEKISLPQNYQFIRYFSSEVGTYRYPSHSFFAPQIFLSFFQLPGSELPSDIFAFSPYLEGIAHRVFFQLTDKVPAFAASHLRALYKLEEELTP
jgi:hypothetical protein